MKAPRLFGYLTPFDTGLGAELELEQFAGVTLRGKLRLLWLVAGVNWELSPANGLISEPMLPLPTLEAWPCGRCHRSGFAAPIPLCTICRVELDLELANEEPPQL